MRLASGLLYLSHPTLAARVSLPSAKTPLDGITTVDCVQLVKPTSGVTAQTPKMFTASVPEKSMTL
jgi:hypothetical protein